MSIRISLIIPLYLICCCLFAQKKTSQLGLSPLKNISQYQCDVWKKENGLPQNSVFAIRQSSEGYLWIATYEGLARFDGVEFNNFNTANVNELMTSGIWEVFEDSQKTLWLGTNNGGLTRYQKGKFKTFTTKEGLPSNTVTKICEDKKKQLWIGTRQGLCLMKGGTFKVFTTKDGLSSKDITALHLGKNNRLWIGTSRGLTLYANGKFIDYTRKILFFNKSITSIWEDRQGILWIGTQAGLVKWDEKNQKFQTLRIEDGLTDDYINKVYQDGQGTLWIGTHSGGLNRVIEKYLQNSKPFIESFTVREGLSTNSITEIFEDREGSLWIGLNRGGLNRLRDGKFTNYTTTEGLTDNVANCIYEDRNGALWIGTVSGGISYFKDGKFKNFTKNDGLSSNYVRSIIEDRTGNLWIATYGNGLNKFSQGKFTNYTIEDGLTGNIIRVLYESPKGGVWVGTKSGLSKLFVNGDKIQVIDYSRKLGLSNNSIVSILEDSKGNLWAGTDGGGLSCLKPDNTFQVFNAPAKLANDLVFSIYEDREGIIWIGTKNGLSRIKNGKVSNIFAKDGLLSDAVHSIVEDNQGRMWVSSNSGIFWVRKSILNQFFEGKITKIIGTFYQEEDGMKSSDCSASAYPTGIKDQKGCLWFPTTNGITMIDPGQIKINAQKPPIVIKSFWVDNQEWDLFQKINLPAGKSKFEFDFAALSFLAPNKIQYKYKLTGDSYSEDWVDAKNKRDTYYTNLPPGNYSFQVIASNNDGIWNNEGAVLEFYLTPFFYQRRIFYVLSVLSVLSLSFGLYYWRVSSLEKSKKALEKGITESTQKIKAQYLEITQQAEELETINAIVKIINEEVKFENVLKALLEQGLSLFSQSHKGIFLLHEAKGESFHLVASQGYDHTSLNKKTFEETEVLEYCETGVQLEEDIYLLQPAINLKKLTPDYRPKSSLAMQITIDEIIKAVIFFDNSNGIQDVKTSEIKKLTRFKEHAVSAFSKAQFLKEIEAKNEALESSYRKISDSIRYARRIQKAILGEADIIARHFKEAFIFFEPKDIVSGDFYWFTETIPEPVFAIEPTSEGQTSVFKGFDNSKYVVAAVDCTGHGVPGAFMTVIGNDLLTAIVMEEKITKADKILYKLDQSLKTYLRQEGGSQSRDGMDIALLVIDEFEGRIEYAGAKNPLFYVRNGEIYVIKASKDTIGGVQSKKKTFDLHSIEYWEGDIFYLFSDGFQDQFGGNHDRKYSTKKFREFLLSISHLPLQEQKQKVEQEFYQWKAEQKQTDDILVMGIKF